MDRKKEYILDGLCCASCAAKIEKEVGDLPEVKEANINLMNSKLSISVDEAGATGLKEKVESIVAAHEASVKVRDTSKEAISDKKPEQEQKEDKSEFRSFLLRLLGTIVIATAFTLLPVPDGVRLAAYAVAYILIGYEVILNAVRNTVKGNLFDENFLMGIASLGAFLIGERIEAIAVLVFYGVGELLQDMAVDRSKKNISGLMDIRPDYANLIKDGSMTVVAPEEVNTGDVILIKPGEKVPLDGIVSKGSSYIDTRALTGESVLREVNMGDEVISGSINTNGVIEVTVTKPFAEATVTKILELVQSAGSRKAPSEKFITKFARYYTPAVVLLAVAVIVIPPLLGFGSFEKWLYRGLSFLIISCPCALVLSIPLSFFGGIGGAARQGILIKGGNYLDALRQVDTIVFDKTGTLTKGVFTVTKICPTQGVDGNKLIGLAAAAESHSTHPIARSILSYVEQNGIQADIIVDQITESAGHGVIATTGSDRILAGNEKLMAENGVTTEQPAVTGSIIYVAFNEQYMGYILISDELKNGVPQAMQALKQAGVRKTVMLTGDHKNAASEIAGLCNIDEYEAELLPQDKVKWFEQYKNSVRKGKIVFVGDGINDAPVLAGADIGIAMGGIGSDAAIEAADIVIMNDDIGKIVTAVKVAVKTRKIVFQNIIFALGVKTLIMILAFLGITSIWFAIFADVGVALLALLNAMRAMYSK